MKLEYDDVRRKLFEKYNLDYNARGKEYRECIDYLARDNCYIELYGYTWRMGSKKTNLRYNRKPIFGKITVDKLDNWYFAEYNPNKLGEVKKEVSATMRHYATTYSEAVEGYNELIDDYLESLNEMKDWANSYRIEE